MSRPHQNFPQHQHIRLILDNWIRFVLIFINVMNNLDTLFINRDIQRHNGDNRD